MSMPVSKIFFQTLLLGLFWSHVIAWNSAQQQPVHSTQRYWDARRFHRLGWKAHLQDADSSSSPKIQSSVANHVDSSIFGGWSRRDALLAGCTLTSCSTVLLGAGQLAAVAAPPPPQRMLDVGGGVDISVDTSSKTLSDPPNIVFPASLSGTRWICERTILSVEGDVYQAQTAWKTLGGPIRNFGPQAPPERYELQFLPASDTHYSVLDRKYELTSRLAAMAAANGKSITTDTNDVAVQWNSHQPNLLRVLNTELAVIQRSVIPPNPNQGIVAGGQELIRIADGPFTRAVQIKQRFRAGPSGDETSLEGLELIKTYRVLDGVAGTEFPTSTTKSLLKLTRIPDATPVAVSSSSSTTTYYDGSTWY